MFEEWIDSFKYAALTTGTFFEGETAILLASIMIFKGMFFLPYTIFFGFLGSFISDWLYYLIGRLNGKTFISRRPALALKAEQVIHFFNRNKVQILFSYRFMYGLRVIIPLVIGMSGLPPRLFLFYSVMAGLSWATIVTALGYSIGALFDVGPEDIRNNILIIIPALAVVGFAVGYFAKRTLLKGRVGMV